MPTPQETIASTQELLRRIQTEGITTNSGQVINPADYGKPITADMLATKQTPANIPTLETVSYPSITAPAPDTNNDMKKLFDLYMKETGDVKQPDYQSIYGEAEKSAGYSQLQKDQAASKLRLGTYQAELQGIIDETKIRRMESQKEGISAGAIQGRNIADERETAIRAIPLQAKILAEQAVLTNNTELLGQAKDKLNTLFTLQSKEAENKYNYEIKKIDSVYQYATAIQKAKLDAKKELDTQKYNENKDRLTTINNLAQNYPDAGITPNDTFEQAQQKAANSPSFLAKQKSGVNVTPTIIKSGNLIISEGTISKGQQVLDSVRGSDGYVYTPKYLEMLDAWRKDEGLEQDFFTNYPPKNYLNPNDASVPKYIRDMLKVSADNEPLFQ